MPRVLNDKSASIKRDAHKRKLVPFFLPHGVVTQMIIIRYQYNAKAP